MRTKGPVSVLNNTESTYVLDNRGYTIARCHRTGKTRENREGDGEFIASSFNTAHKLDTLGVNGELMIRNLPNLIRMMNKECPDLLNKFIQDKK